MRGDTWGISGAAFAAGYASLAVLAIGGALLHRYRALAGPARVDARALSPQQVAYLWGGPELAVYSALAALRCAGAVGVSTSPGPDGRRPERRLVATGPPAEDATAFERAVHDAATRSALPGSLRADPVVAAELARTAGSLAGAGLIPDAQTRAALTMARHLLTAVLLLGVARLLAGVANEKPVIFVLLTVLVLGGTVAALWRWRPARTRAADRALAVLRGGYPHLAPAHRPAWQVYGPAAAALAVGLYGSHALWVADPGFAAEAAVRKDLATAYAQSASSAGTSTSDGAGAGHTCSSCGGGTGDSGSSGGSGSGGGGGSGSGSGGGGGCGGGGCGG
ncbi:TIGR04222 domain-containing membrane protein [Phytohabitans suffuscus]|uniref:TIGR04222 domain-containing membrane protein n=1 Tax=Phytohabitans suffuscus TaxID=624315 RepID=A0A6F8YXE1_9ACTN|nr:TIGR04222 domain-containing membrane protein [Phytohabitans suffuscus]BCB90807.1 hypothetical protein Psuf_081200 [Phytohabitans suffuscus]